MRYGRYLAGLLVLGIALLFSIQSEAAAKKTIYNSPYVSFSPDGRAFTTCAGDRNYVWSARVQPCAIDKQIKGLAMTAAKAVMAAQQGWVCRCFKKWIVITAQ